MRNILEKVRKSDHAEVKTGAQAIYLAEGRGKAETAFRSFGARWRRQYGAVVRRLEQDLPELLSFFAFPRHLWRKLRTTNVIELLLRGSATENPTYGVLCERRKCGPHHLLHLPEIPS